MTAWHAALALGVASCLFAQQPGQPAGKFYGPLASGSWPRVKGNTVAPRVSGMPKIYHEPSRSSPPLCAVPLVPMAIPPDMNFAIQKTVPPKDYHDNRMSMKPPVPACDQASVKPPSH